MSSCSPLSRLLVLTFILALLIPASTLRADNKNKKNTKASSKDTYQKIEAAVIAGKITKEQAQAKLKALQKQGDSKSKPVDKSQVVENAKPVDKSGGDKTIARLENIWSELNSLVAAGKLSQEEANSVMGTIKQKVFNKQGAKKQSQAKSEPKSLYQYLEEAVRAGKITKEEAQAKLKAQQEKMSNQDEAGRKAADAGLHKAWAELQAAVKAGKLTKEEAVAKMKAVKKAKLVEK